MNFKNLLGYKSKTVIIIIQLKSKISKMETVIEVNARLPFDYALIEGIGEKEASKNISRRVALELYREGKISFGKCAELIGVTKWGLFDIFKEHGIEMNYDVEEFLEDKKQYSN